LPFIDRIGLAAPRLVRHIETRRIDKAPTTAAAIENLK
jgi:hypothetical protein